MSNQHSGNIQPSIDYEEHQQIGGVNGKKVFIFDNNGNQIINSAPTVSILSYTTYLNYSLVSGYNFYGFANPGSNPTTANFRLQRETILTGEVLFGNGLSVFNSIWSVASMPSIAWS